MMGYVIIVDFQLKPGMRAAFRRLVDANARISAQIEKGCRRFDVLEPAGEGDRLLLYEIYDDEAAFDAHARSAHYERFDTDSSAMVSAKSILRCNLVFDGGVATQN